MTYLEQRQAYILAGRPLKIKEKKPIAKVSKKRAEKIKQQSIDKTDEGLDYYFDYHMKHSKPVCMECGFEAWWLLKPEYATIWRACQAHILPKKKNHGFPSIASNLDNHLVLFPSWGGHLCGCHGFYDSNWYNASTMKIWNDVVEIFKTKLYQNIAENERKNIPDVLAELISG